MQSKADTVEEFLASLPKDRRSAITAVRDLVRRSIDDDIEEGMQSGEPIEPDDANATTRWWREVERGL